MYIIGTYVSKPSAKMPYSKIRQYGITIEGLPCDLKHPSCYGKDTLKEILSQRDQLKILGVQDKVTYVYVRTYAYYYVYSEWWIEPSVASSYCDRYLCTYICVY